MFLTCIQRLQISGFLPSKGKSAIIRINRTVRKMLKLSPEEEKAIGYDGRPGKPLWDEALVKKAGDPKSEFVFSEAQAEAIQKELIKLDGKDEMQEFLLDLEDLFVIDKVWKADLEVVAAREKEEKHRKKKLKLLKGKTDPKPDSGPCSEGEDDEDDDQDALDE